MKKIIQILKNNSAYLAMKKGKGEIVVSHASDEAILIASAFFACPKTMLVIKDSLYQAQQHFTYLLTKALNVSPDLFHKSLDDLAVSDLDTANQSGTRE